MLWLIAAGIALTAIIGLIVMLLTSGGGGATDSAARISQYDYSFDVPPGWHQVGGDPQNWQTLVAPAGGSDSDRIAVQEGRLGFPAESDPDRAVRELREEYEQRVEAGDPFADFAPRASFAGRDVTYYREQRDGATAEWYVLHRGSSRVFIGCQYAPAAVADVRAACEQVVGSVRIR